MSQRPDSYSQILRATTSNGSRAAVDEQTGEAMLKGFEELDALSEFVYYINCIYIYLFIK